MFTIVICTYNGARFLRKNLDAILRLKCLDRLVDKVLLVDNNSSDDTKKIALEYAERNSLIKYEFERRQGLSFAREHAVNADTEWVIYVDDDNILSQDWLVHLNSLVKGDDRLGIVNGAVIAVPYDELTKQERSILEVMYRNLACTHLCIPQKDDVENQIPMGAGLCVKTKALQKIYNEGWLRLKGRNGKALSSGEDTELCARILSQGYLYRCDYEMTLEHLIPKERLSIEYTIRLIDGLVKGRVDFLKTQRHWVIAKFVRILKYNMVLLQLLVVQQFVKDNTSRYWSNFVEKIQAEAFLRYL